MENLPVLSGKEIVRLLSKVGYGITRHRGSHMRRACPGKTSVTVPDYKMVSRGLLAKILRDAKVSRQVFVELINDV